VTTVIDSTNGDHKAPKEMFLDYTMTSRDLQPAVSFWAGPLWSGHSRAMCPQEACSGIEDQRFPLDSPPHGAD
jgi:hypothetical protein